MTNQIQNGFGAGVSRRKNNLNLTNMHKVMKVIAAIMLTAAVVIAAGCTKTDIPNNGSNNGGNNGGGSNNGHSYVDLGLPSGT